MEIDGGLGDSLAPGKVALLTLVKHEFSAKESEQIETAGTAAVASAGTPGA